jgi:ribosomal protein L11 methyltransferase
VNGEIVTFSIDVDDTIDADLVSDVLWSSGVQGVEEIEIDNRRIRLRSSFGTAEPPTLRRLEDLFGSWDPPLRWSISRVDPEITETWRKFAEIIEITPTLRIVPAWLTASPSAPNCTDIIIDPGATFGMGDHPTTRASLVLMARLLRSGDRVLDVGCGSGILGITALVLGASHSCGIDINPASVDVSHSNALRNDVDEMWSVSLDDIGTVTDRFDLIVANILAPVLIQIADDLIRLLDDNGTLVISGVLRDRHDHVVKALDPLTVIDFVEIDGWSAVALRR